MTASPAAFDAPCPITRFNALLGGKYKLRILWEVRATSRRYSEIRRALAEAGGGASITPRVLSRELSELVASRFLHRQPYAEVPPRVEYRLTSRGRKALVILRAVSKWGKIDSDGLDDEDVPTLESA
jgi:DNA-binding HxlR family transcriptional regulator